MDRDFPTAEAFKLRLQQHLSIAHFSIETKPKQWDWMSSVAEKFQIVYRV
jgi:hypothetical protein